MIKSLSFYPGVKTIPTEAVARQKQIKWLLEHPIWRDEEGEQKFHEYVDIDFLPFVNPDTGLEDIDAKKNTVMSIRIEAGEKGTHDRRFDYWAPTLEEALLELAMRVQFFYNEEGYERLEVPQPCVLKCEKFSDNHCVKCGFVKNWWKYWGRSL